MLPQPFSVDATGTPGGAPVITPWKRLVPDPRFAGSWALFGDLDGDGQAELVSARSWTNHDYPNDRHYVTTVVATDLDGKIGRAHV